VESRYTPKCDVLGCTEVVKYLIEESKAFELARRSWGHSPSVVAQLWHLENDVYILYVLQLLLHLGHLSTYYGHRSLSGSFPRFVQYSKSSFRVRFEFVRVRSRIRFEVHFEDSFRRVRFEEFVSKSSFRRVHRSVRFEEFVSSSVVRRISFRESSFERIRSKEFVRKFVSKGSFRKLFRRIHSKGSFRRFISKVHSERHTQLWPGPAQEVSFGDIC
jgi:hypothetical protein